VLTSSATTIQPAAARSIYPLAFFFTLAYLIGWSPIPLLDQMARETGLESWRTLMQMAETGALDSLELPVPGWTVFAITRVQDFAFTIAGLLVIATMEGPVGLRNLGRRLLGWRFNRWCWLVTCLPLILYLTAIMASTGFDSFRWSAENLSRSLFSLEAGLLVTLLCRGPMGEEPGLRGFALPRLQALTTPFRASMVIGVLWAGWHLPVLAGRDPLSVVAFLLLAFSLSFVFTWLFNNSGGSLIPVMLMHGFQNNEEMFEVFVPALRGTEWELLSTLGLLSVGILFGLLLWRQSGRKSEERRRAPC